MGGRLQVFGPRWRTRTATGAASASALARRSAKKLHSRRSPRASEGRAADCLGSTFWCSPDYHRTMKRYVQIVGLLSAISITGCVVRGAGSFDIDVPKIVIDADGVAETTSKSFAEISTETGGVSMKAKAAVDLPDRIIAVFKKAVPKNQPVDLVFVVDTTGSMQDDIDEARRKMKQIVAALDDRNPDNRVGVVAYRDKGDAYVARTFTKLEAGEKRVLRSLDKLKADGGGDFPEHVFAGIVEALEEQPWREGATHHVLVIGDAPPQSYKDDRKNTRANVKKLAKEKDVKIHTIGLNCKGAC